MMQLASLCAALLVLESSAHWGRRRDSLRRWIEDCGSRDASETPKWQRKLCKKIGHGDSSDWESKADVQQKLRDQQDKSQRLHQELEQEKAQARKKETRLEKEASRWERQHRSLQQQLQEEKKQAKQKLEAKVGELERERRNRREKNMALQYEKSQTLLVKSKLEAKVDKYQSDLVHCKRRLDAKADELAKANQWRTESKLTSKVEAAMSVCESKHKLEVDLMNCSRRLDAKADELAKEKQRRKELLFEHRDKIEVLQAQADSASKRAESVTLELQKMKEMANQQSSQCQRLPELLLQNVSDMASQIDEEKRNTRNSTEALLQCQTELKTCGKMASVESNDIVAEETSEKINAKHEGSTLYIAVIGVFVFFIWKGLHGLYVKNCDKNLRLSTLDAELLKKNSLLWNFEVLLGLREAELSQKDAQLSAVQMEFNSELGGMMKLDQSSPTLGTDFTFHIFDEIKDQEKVRSIKTQCAGVYHKDVSVEIIFNGCIITIRREASKGVDQVEWIRKFQFRPSEGLFEFKEDQAALEAGILSLVFRATPYQSRMFRFPKHFDMAAADPDGTYEFPPESAEGNGTEASIAQHGCTAPGRLEMTAEAEEFARAAAGAAGASTSGSPIDTEDYEATARAVNAAQVLPGSSSTSSYCMVEIQTSAASGDPVDADQMIAEKGEGQAKAGSGDGEAVPPVSDQQPSPNGDVASSWVSSAAFDIVEECDVQPEESGDVNF